MKKYKALMFRIWKLFREKYLLAVLLYLLIAGFMFLPLLFEILNDDRGNWAREMQEFCAYEGTMSLGDAVGAFFFLAIPIVLSVAILFGMLDFWKADMHVGWNKLARTLPVKSSEYARVYVLMRLLFTLGFGVLTLVYAVLMGKSMGCSIWRHGISVFNLMAALLMLGEIAGNIFRSTLRDEKKAEEIIAFIGFFIGMIVFGCSFSSEREIYVKEFLDFIGGGLFFFMSILALIVSSLVSVLVMSKLYERRLP